MSVALLTWILGWGSGAVRALVLMKGWEWFVADTFDVPGLGFIQTWGLWLLISLTTVHLTASDDKRLTIAYAFTTTLTSLVLSGIWFASIIILAGFR